MPGRDYVRVEGLREMNRAFARADRDMKRHLRSALKDVAEPVREDAERLAGQKVRNMGAGPWAGMRVGVTTNLVYVAPKKRGTRGRGPSRRPNLADLLMGRAMAPALEEHAEEIEDRFGDAVDSVLARWGH